MLNNPGTVLIHRVENLLIFLLVTVVTVAEHCNFWLILLMFLVWDLSMLGYLINNRKGAFIYNAFHNYSGGVVILLINYALGNNLNSFIGLVGLSWLFHVSLDRALGYGLKYITSFQDTDLKKL